MWKVTVSLKTQRNKRHTRRFLPCQLSDFFFPLMLIFFFLEYSNFSKASATKTKWKKSILQQICITIASELEWTHHNTFFFFFRYSTFGEHGSFASSHSQLQFKVPGYCALIMLRICMGTSCWPKPVWLNWNLLVQSNRTVLVLTVQ